MPIMEILLINPLVKAYIIDKRKEIKKSLQL